MIATSQLYFTVILGTVISCYHVLRALCNSFLSSAAHSSLLYLLTNTATFGLLSSDADIRKASAVHYQVTALLSLSICYF